ncbi:cytochrome c3 family protein [Thermodesulfovibrio sp.]|uniref:cytochrome c3 family protein n=1 Tax=Thermodesulfovibrio sp. TaxID=2067987 RepID=UPI0030A47F4F
MRSKKGLIILTLAMFLLAISIVYAQQKPQDVYKLHWEGAKFPPTEFNHKKHAENYKIDCKTCHHTDANPAEKATKCIECHDPQGEKAAEKGGGIKAMDAYHKQCIDCHKKENEAGKAAPTKCNDCHKKA